MTKFIALVTGALLLALTPALAAEEKCNIEPMDGIPAQAEAQGYPYRVLSAEEIKLILTHPYLASSDAVGEGYDSALLAVIPGPVGMLVLGKGGQSCGIVPLPPPVLIEVIKTLKGTEA